MDVKAGHDQTNSHRVIDESFGVEECWYYINTTHSSICRSAALSLPAGRHVLKFNMSAPLGYYVNLVSTTEFTFGDEEEVMPKLRAVSVIYLTQACPQSIVNTNKAC